MRTTQSARCSRFRRRGRDGGFGCGGSGFGDGRRWWWRGWWRGRRLGWPLLGGEEGAEFAEGAKRLFAFESGLGEFGTRRLPARLARRWRRRWSLLRRGCFAGGRGGCRRWLLSR